MMYNNHQLDATIIFTLNIWTSLSSVYGKYSKNSNTKTSDKMTYANSVDPDQTAPEGAADQGLHCVPFH